MNTVIAGWRVQTYRVNTKRPGIGWVGTNIIGISGGILGHAIAIYREPKDGKR